VEVAKSGDLAYSTGDWKQVYTQDGKERRSSGNYLAVWKKQGDGSWKVLLDKP
jgi:ketosteroid isomerase-like protein